jgi:hypothetical protein
MVLTLKLLMKNCYKDSLNERKLLSSYREEIIKRDKSLKSKLSLPDLISPRTPDMSVNLKDITI